MCLCVKVEDEKSAGESQTKQEKEKHDEKKDDSEEGTDHAGKCIINFTHRHQDQDNVSIKTCTVQQIQNDTFDTEIINLSEILKLFCALFHTLNVLRILIYSHPKVWLLLSSNMLLFCSVSALCYTAAWLCV